jgi:2-polyprenyl-3-methyl-5-hydroxy-6-metoxy-1,4-benzoquinol methylase
MVTEEVCPGCDSAQIQPLARQPFLSQCSACRLVFDNPRHSAREIAAYYSAVDKYDLWLRHLESRETMWRRRLTKMLARKKPGSLLDIGAGIGQFLALARNEYTRVEGTEVSATAVTIARERFGIDLRHGEALDMRWTERFDNITLFHVLEHVHRPIDMLRKCHALLGPGGVLTLAVPNDQESLRARLGREKLAPISLAEHEVHLSHFTEKTLRALLERAGFQVREASVDPYWPIKSLKQEIKFAVLATVYRLTGRNLYETIWISATRA